MDPNEGEGRYQSGTLPLEGDNRVEDGLYLRIWNCVRRARLALRENVLGHPR